MRKPVDHHFSQNLFRLSALSLTVTSLVTSSVWAESPQADKERAVAEAYKAYLHSFSDREKAMVAHWAPEFLVESDLKETKTSTGETYFQINPRDTLVSPDFDGDLDLTNNEASLTHFRELAMKDAQGKASQEENDTWRNGMKAKVPGDLFTETPSHYFIKYPVYHVFDSGHPHDSETVMLMIRKDGSDFGHLEAFAVEAHGMPVFYSHNPAIQQQLRENQERGKKEGLVRVKSSPIRAFDRNIKPTSPAFGTYDNLSLSSDVTAGIHSKAWDELNQEEREALMPSDRGPTVFITKGKHSQRVGVATLNLNAEGAAAVTAVSAPTPGLGAIQFQSGLAVSNKLFGATVRYTCESHAENQDSSYSQNCYRLEPGKLNLTYELTPFKSLERRLVEADQSKPGSVFASDSKEGARDVSTSAATLRYSGNRYRDYPGGDATFEWNLRDNELPWFFEPEIYSRYLLGRDGSHNPAGLAPVSTTRLKAADIDEVPGVNLEAMRTEIIPCLNESQEADRNLRDAILSAAERGSAL